MYAILKNTARGKTRIGWLNSKHTFSFGGYYNPNAMGYRSLRVINDDRVAPGAGFPTHPHRDMEIISYVIEGALEHKDSMGTGSVIEPGDIQIMSAGTGVTHSEYNASKTEPVHFLQIWLPPSRQGLEPGYQQRRFEPKDRRGRLALLASPDGRDGSVVIHRDAELWGGFFDVGEHATHELAPGRGVWIHVVRGSIEVAGQRLSEGDGMAIEDEPSIDIKGVDDAEIILFDLDQ